MLPGASAVFHFEEERFPAETPGVSVSGNSWAERLQGSEVAGHSGRIAALLGFRPPPPPEGLEPRESSVRWTWCLINPEALRVVRGGPCGP